ncbi:hypothetical protein L2725_20105 [Shewanella corallii]|uniref:Thermonuclease family protein n=1 Tax=Shewanella corallii TaxID=560080 RepID=A0ABT0NC43_9GAMM|nr:hypothetical protein [Shewanella corallii]MCL2916048.1 hypothetical protein [Shewanella corallii]
MLSAIYLAITVQVVSVSDGDTVRVVIPDWPDVVGLNIPVRIRGIDTAETVGGCPKPRKMALEAKTLLSKILSKAQNIEIKNIERGKW